MNDEVYEEMFRVEGRHWWFGAKHRIVRSLLRRYAPPASGRPRVIDLGCGCGYLLSLLQQDGYDAIGLDGSAVAVEFSRKRGVAVQQGRLPDQVPFEDASADVILFLDVLEHVPDDAAVYQRAVRLLKPGGIAICTVPAYPWLWTKRDDYHQHYRRYTRRTFRTLMASGGMQPVFVSYLNTLLFPVAMAERAVRKAFPLKAGDGDLAIPPLPLNAALREVYATERLMVGRVPLPFGLSVVSVARRA